MIGPRSGIANHYPDHELTGLTVFEFALCEAAIDTGYFQNAMQSNDISVTAC